MAGPLHAVSLWQGGALVPEALVEEGAMKRRRLTAAMGVGLGALLGASCIYDRAPERATFTTWETRDDAGEPMAERQASINDLTSPFVGAARPASAGGPGVDEGGPPGESGEEAVRESEERQRLEEEHITERVDPRSGDRVVIIEDAERVEVRVDGTRRAATAPETTAARSEETRESVRREAEPREPGDAPLVEEATPEAPRVAEPALRDIAEEGAPSEPLIAEGMLRDDACPTELEGAGVALVERPEGPTLVFQARDAEQVEELQSRVMALALTKDDERVEVSSLGTGAALFEETRPQVRPPSETEMQEGGEGDMPFNLPTELTNAEQEEEPSSTVAGRFAALPEAEVTVELTDEGADVLFEPRLEGERGALTRQLEARARALREGECPADTMSMLTSTPG